MLNNLELAMIYLGKIEAELNKVAETIEHPSFKEFFEGEAADAISSIDGSQGYALCCCGAGSYTHICDRCGVYLD